MSSEYTLSNWLIWNFILFKDFYNQRMSLGMLLCSYLLAFSYFGVLILRNFRFSHSSVPHAHRWACISIELCRDKRDNMFLICYGRQATRRLQSFIKYELKAQEKWVQYLILHFKKGSFVIGTQFLVHLQALIFLSFLHTFVIKVVNMLEN